MPARPWRDLAPKKRGQRRAAPVNHKGFTLNGRRGGPGRRGGRRACAVKAAAMFLGGYVPTVCGEQLSEGRSLQFTLNEAKGSDISTNSAFLTGSAPQTEFAVTRSKQRTATFLTGARMHIRIFGIRQPQTPKPARRGRLARANLPARRCNT